MLGVEGVPAQSRRSSMLTFRSGGHRYALLAAQVAEVIRLRTLAPLPRARPPMLGATAHRGAVVLIADLGLWPHPGLRALRETPFAAVLCGPRADLALAMDAEPTLMEPTSPWVASAGSPPWILGRLSDGTSVLDADAILLHRDFQLEPVSLSGGPS